MEERTFCFSEGDARAPCVPPLVMALRYIRSFCEVTLTKWDRDSYNLATTQTVFYKYTPTQTNFIYSGGSRIFLRKGDQWEFSNYFR